MSSMNKAMVIGRLGKDCEMKFMPNGKAVANFSIATSESWKDKTTGEKQEKTEWHNIVAFDKLAEICGNYLKKGSLAFVEGKLQTRKWTDKNGVDRYSTEILANDMRMLGSKKDSEKSEESPSYAHQAPAGGGDRSTVDFDEEIPFAQLGNFQH